jgi:hypothetical protein
MMMARTAGYGQAARAHERAGSSMMPIAVVPLTAPPPDSLFSRAENKPTKLFLPKMPGFEHFLDIVSG